MIRIERISIHEFRGIRDFTVDIKGNNFAACGPNGTGKSGIVDGIEFALTGNVSRLAGSGTGGLSVKLHGPHVDSRNKPDQAWVSLDVTIPSLKNKKATIRRTVKAAGTPTITPNDPDVLAAFESVASHPEFVLSRRELIRYVLSEAAKRSQQVQALLRLDDIEKLRAVLNKISNASTKELEPLARLETEAVNSLLAALGIPQLSKTLMLTAANDARAAIGLAPLIDIDATTSLKDGLATTPAASTATRVSKVESTKDLATARAGLAELVAQPFQATCAASAAEAAVLAADSTVVDGVTRAELLKAAVDVFDEKVCPVCDTAFEPDEFRAHIEAKLKHFDVVAAKRVAFEAQIKPLLDGLVTAGTSLAAIITHCATFAPPIDASDLSALKAVLGGRYSQLKKVLPLGDTATILRAMSSVADVAPALAVFEARITAIPEPTKQDAARDFLVVAQERLENYRAAKLKVTAARSRADHAAAVYKLYGDVTTTRLEQVYADVEGAFTGYYREINKDDESAFTAKLTPSIGKLSFDVDFYGRGHFPPGAYHSEGHQDGMGLCLYLSLMSHLLASDFTFAVLDDVLMSVDTGHRRSVCAVLKKHFPTVQFIFTTHDEIWLKHMKSEGLIKPRGFAHFRTWTVDVGPAEWDDFDVWAELQVYLNKDDVRGAAALLRHYLEHFCKEACERLHAQVEYRGDAQFTLGELLPNANAALGGLLKKAKAAANSWNQQDAVKAIGEQADALSAILKAAQVDDWQINAAVHYNAWADLHKTDFAPVVETYKSLTAAYTCPNCSQMYQVISNGPVRQTLKCDCGGLNLNLLPKKG